MHELWLSCVSGFGTRALVPLQEKKPVDDAVSLLCLGKRNPADDLTSRAIVAPESVIIVPA